MQKSTQHTNKIKNNSFRKLGVAIFYIKGTTSVQKVFIQLSYNNILFFLQTRILYENDSRVCYFSDTLISPFLIFPAAL